MCSKSLEFTRLGTVRVNPNSHYHLGTCMCIHVCIVSQLSLPWLMVTVRGIIILF